MSTGPFSIPLGAPLDMRQLVQGFASHWDNQPRVMYMGHKDQGAGTTVDLTFMASRNTKYVQVHVQSDAVGKGGFDYDPDNYISSTQVDCRTNRLQAVEVPRNGLDHYWVFLIPKVVYD